MKITLEYAGAVQHPAKAANIELRLKELEAELKAEGLTGSLKVELEGAEAS